MVIGIKNLIWDHGSALCHTAVTPCNILATLIASTRREI
jgi:hypothetical protein